MEIKDKGNLKCRIQIGLQYSEEVGINSFVRTDLTVGVQWERRYGGGGEMYVL